MVSFSHCFSDRPQLLKTASEGRGKLSYIMTTELGLHCPKPCVFQRFDLNSTCHSLEQCLISDAALASVHYVHHAWRWEPVSNPKKTRILWLFQHHCKSIDSPWRTKRPHMTLEPFEHLNKVFLLLKRTAVLLRSPAKGWPHMLSVKHSHDMTSRKPAARPERSQTCCKLSFQ